MISVRAAISARVASISSARRALALQKSNRARPSSSSRRGVAWLPTSAESSSRIRSISTCSASCASRQALPELDGDQRLHEQGLAAARGVVDDALHPVLRVGPHGDDVPAVAQRDDRLLERGARLARMDQLVEAGPQPVVRDPGRPTQPAETDGRGVEQVARRIEAALQHRAERRQRVERAGEVAQQRPPIVGERVAQAAPGLQRLRDRHELERIEPSAARGAFDRRADVVRAADAGAGLLGEQLARPPMSRRGRSRRGRGRRRAERLRQAAAGREPGRVRPAARGSAGTQRSSDLASISVARTAGACTSQKRLGRSAQPGPAYATPMRGPDAIAGPRRPRGWPGPGGASRRVRARSPVRGASPPPLAARRRQRRRRAAPAANASSISRWSAPARRAGPPVVGASDVERRGAFAGPEARRASAIRAGGPPPRPGRGRRRAGSPRPGRRGRPHRRRRRRAARRRGPGWRLRCPAGRSRR